MSVPDNLIKCITIPPLANSDHLGLLVSITAGSVRSQPKRKRRKIWRYSHADFDRACELIEATDWDSLISSNDIDTCWANWSKRFLQIMEDCIPQSVVRSRRNLPWLTKSITQAIRRRNMLFRTFKRTSSPTANQKFRAARNRVVAMLRLSKAKFFRSLQTLKPKEFWKAVKLLNKQESSVPTLSSNGNDVSDDREKAHLLNNYFYECFNKRSSPVLNNLQSLPSQDFPSDLLCDEAEIFDLIVNMDPSKSTGPDGISVRMLRGTAVAAVTSLSKLFNKSLTSGKFPQAWKMARVVPVPKAGDTSSVSNYRPISILSVVSKLLEKHIHRLLFDHLCNKYPLSSRQWGFLPGRSATSALLSVTHDWLEQLEQGKEVCSIFFDLRKAFDSVPHCLLLQKLCEIGTNPYIVQWTRSYLTDRTQIVVVGGEQSPAVPVISGVPQGSVLGPLLFTIFINDVIHQVSPGSAMSLFADDMALYRPIRTTDDYHVLQSDITAIVDWINNLLLSLQPAKCCFMMLSRKKRPGPTPTLMIGDTPLACVSSVKYLGVQLTPDLSWSPHVSDICKKARRLIGLLYRRFYKNTDTSTLLHLFKTFVRPHLEYCSTVWDPHLLGDIEALEKVQRFGLRMCLKKWDADRHQVCELSQTPPLSTRRKVARLCHLYKIINNLTDYPEPPLQPRTLHRNSRSSHGSQLASFRARTAQFQNSFFPNTVSQWNTLPQETVSSSSLSLFKSYLLSHT